LPPCYSQVSFCAFDILSATTLHIFAFYDLSRTFRKLETCSKLRMMLGSWDILAIVVLLFGADLGSAHYEFDGQIMYVAVHSQRSRFVPRA